MSTRAADVLGQAPLLVSATADELGRLAASASSRRVARGQVLFVEGDPSDHLFVVVRGRLKVLVSSAQGGELVLAVLGPGSSLGELSVLDGEARSASAEALDDGEVLAVPAAVVREVVAGSPALSLAWAHELALTVRRLTGASADLVFLDLPRRLAKLVLEAGPGALVDLGMAQGDVAARLGVARQSLNRALAGLQRRGWLEVDGTTVHLRDRAALERFAAS